MTPVNQLVMKGKLKNTPKGWTVLYTECRPKGHVTEWNKSLLVHPKYVKYYFLDEDAEGAEVEFEIVKEYIDTHTNQVETYAKLNRHVPDVGKKVPDHFGDVNKMISDEEIEKPSFTKELNVFLRWTMMHYSTVTIDGMFGWVDSMGNEVTTAEIVSNYQKFSNDLVKDAIQWYHEQLKQRQWNKQQ